MQVVENNNWLEVANESGAVRISPVGVWRIANLNAIRQALVVDSFRSSANIIVDGSKLEALDTAGAMLLFECFSFTGKQNVQLQNFSESQARLFSLVAQQLKNKSPKIVEKHFGLLEEIGLNGIYVWSKVKGLATFLGYSAIEALRVLRRPRLLRFKELFVQLEHTCIYAIPITCLLTFLIGVVVAYLSAIQIEKFGANIFIVDAVTITMCRELSPILVAVLVAGRSGSAFTAQIGAMKINEEIDAITSLGLTPFRVLVLPRIIALMIAMPILVFIGDIMGILGGMLIADLRLSISGYTFIDRIQAVLPLRSFLVGLVKAPVFALFIALIGCREGLEVKKNARSLGLSTTSTVVQSIVAVILLNAAFAVIFVELGI